MNNVEIREKLNASISGGNRVILFDCDSLDFMHILCEKLALKNNPDVEIWQSIEAKSNNKQTKYVSKEIVDIAVDIYNMYDFSDKVFVVSRPDQYGSLFNYVKTGILTSQEMVDALLYKI